MSEDRYGFVSMDVVDEALATYVHHERKKVGIVYDQTNDEVIAITPSGGATAEWLMSVLNTKEATDE